MNEHQTIEARFYNRTGQMLSTAIEEMGGDYHYRPSRFLTQFNWIEETFYSTTGSGKANRFYQRMTTEAAVDTNALAIKATLIERYGKNLDAVIRKYCVSLIPPTSGTRFLPNDFNKITTVEGVLFANSWVRPEYQPTGAIHMRRPDLWQQYLDRIMPQEEDCWWTQSDESKVTHRQQDYFEAFIAQRLQRPQEPCTVAMILGGEQGTGKGFWADVMMRQIIGRTNYKAVSLSDVKGSFNADLFETVLLHIEEINDQRGKVAEILKPYVTPDEQRFNAKYKAQAQAQVRKHFGLVLSSNHQNPILIEATDRRYFVPAFSKHQSHQGETKAFYQCFADWLSNEGGFQTMCDWLYQIDIAKYDFRSAAMTSDKQDTTVYETRSEGHMTRAVFKLTKLADTPFLFIAAEVAGHFKLSDGDGQAALRQAGYVADQRHHKGRKARYWSHPKHLQKTGCAFSLWTPNSGSCPTVRDAPDLSVVR